MILFKMDLHYPRKTTVADFMDKIDNNVICIKNKEYIHLSNLHLSELQKYTDIPLTEITFEELKEL